MRARSLLALALAWSTVALAPNSASAKPGTFWERAVDPNGAELRVIRDKVSRNIDAARATNDILRGPIDFDDEVGEHKRRKLLVDALGMLRFGLKLEPNDTWLLERTGFVMARLGRLHEARAALRRYMRNEKRERIDADTHVRLGRIHARLREWADAVVQLRVSLNVGGSRSDSRAQAIVSLASIFMHRGRMNDAIDLLAAELTQSQPLRSFYDGDPLVQFTLAVAYDRDDQHALASKLLAKMTQRGQLSLSMLRRRIVGNDVEDIYVPAIDRHYFAALLYKISGHTAEARTEFLNYSGSADAKYRDRARAHVANIDATTRVERTK